MITTAQHGKWVAALFLVSCGFVQVEPAPDAGSDAAADVRVDVGDAGQDAPFDAGDAFDAGVDAGPPGPLPAGGTGPDRVRGVTTDASGNVYLVGTFEQAFRVGDEDLTPGPTDSTFLISYSPSGMLRWARAWGASRLSLGADIEVVGSRVLVLGYMGGTLTRDPGPLVSGPRQALTLFEFAAADGATVSTELYQSTTFRARRLMRVPSVCWSLATTLATPISVGDRLA